MLDFIAKNNYVNEVPIVFSDTLAAGTAKTYEKTIDGNGTIKKIHITFATGENGTLHITPYVIWNGNIRRELLNYADGAGKYIAGDSVNFDLNAYCPVETNCKLCVLADNTGTGTSNVDVVIVVEYTDTNKTPTIIGSK